MTSVGVLWNVVDPTLPAATNLARGGSASQSSTLDLGLDFSASNAIDGVRGGNFPANAIAHTEGDVEAWWQIDLGARYNLSEVVIFNREDCCADALRDYHLFVSDTPFAGESVTASLGQSGVSSFYTAGVSPRENAIGLNRTGRYLRIQLTAAEYLQLAEVEVYGSPL